MFLLSFICIPLVPLLMLIGPTCFLLYDKYKFSSELAYMGSIWAINNGFYYAGKFSYFCIRTDRCGCFRGRRCLSYSMATLIFILFTIPLYIIIAAITTALALVFGTPPLLLVLICYQSRVLKTLTTFTFF